MSGFVSRRFDNADDAAKFARVVVVESYLRVLSPRARYYVRGRVSVRGPNVIARNREILADGSLLISRITEIVFCEEEEVRLIRLVCGTRRFFVIFRASAWCSRFILQLRNFLANLLNFVLV